MFLLNGARDLSDFLEFLSWLFSDGGPTDLGGLVRVLGHRPSFFIYFAGTIAIAALLVWVVFRFAFPRRSRIGPPRWGAGLGVVVTFCAFLVMAIVQVGVWFLFESMAFPPSHLIQTRSMSVAALISAPLICVGAYFFLKGTAHARPGDMGLDSRGVPANLGRGVLLVLLLIPLVMIVALIGVLYFRTVGVDTGEQDVVRMMRQETSPLFVALMYAMALLAAPVWEELIFRGVLYKGLCGSFGRDEAILISALVFASIHGSVAAFIPIFLLAIFLAYAYERTGSLLTPIAMHFVYNLFNVVLIHIA